MGMSYVKNNYLIDVGLGKVEGMDYLHKFGRNEDIPNAVGTFEALWHGGGPYTGFNCTVASILEVSSASTADKGQLLCSGTVTKTSKLRLIDDTATFISDGVAKGDVVLDDTDRCHGIISSIVAETELAVYRFDKGAGRSNSEARIGDSYRVASTLGTGASVIHLQHLLDNDLCCQRDEFVILDGTTVVTTAGEYKRNARGAVLITGSGLVNAGDITSKQSINAANIMMVAPAGYNKSMICAYTIPFDVKGAHLLSLFSSLAGKSTAITNVRYVVRHIGEVFEVFEEFSLDSQGDSYIQRIYPIPKDGLSPGSDIALLADSNANSTGVAGGLDLLIEL
jgi:hypothetical protein